MAAITSMFISIDDSGKILVHVPKTSSVVKNCSDNTRRVSILRNHMVEKGPKNELFTEKCDNKNDAPLSRNKLLYTSIVGDCQNNFVCEVDLKNHQAKQHAITQYHSSNVRVEKTVEDAVPINDSDRRLIARKRKENAAKLACEMCGQMTRKDWMARHLTNVHGVPVNSEVKTVRSFPKVKCPKCEKMLSTSILHRHMVAVHKIRSETLTMVSCHLCSKQMTSSKLWSHVKFGCQERKSKDPAYCENGQKRPKAVVKAVINLEKELTESKEWMRKFREVLDLTKVRIDQAIGKRRNELGLKMACDVCGIQVRKDWMKRHMINVHRIGTQRKQVHVYPKVECPNCTKKVSTVGLARHMSKIHQLRGALELLVPCHVCGEQVQCTTMDYHVRTNCGSSKHTKKIIENDNKNE